MARLLVVDDEPRLVSFLTRALTSAGYAVDASPDGRDALARATTGIYDLIVLDLMLPELDGTAVLRGIVEAVPDQRVLVLSAVCNVGDRVRCLQLGAADYLVKPFSLDELLARIAARLRPVHEEPSSVLVVGRIRLDGRRRTVDVGSGPVGLSQTEFLLLQELMVHPGGACTRQQLLQAVWGYTFDPGSNIVDVYVRRLRAKLGEDVVETVRNVGYQVRFA